MVFDDDDEFPGFYCQMLIFTHSIQGDVEKLFKLVNNLKMVNLRTDSCDKNKKISIENKKVISNFEIGEKNSDEIDSIRKFSKMPLLVFQLRFKSKHQQK